MNKYKLSIAQSSIVSMEESYPKDSFNNIGGLILFRDKFDFTFLQETINDILEKNDVFNLRISVKDGEYYQYRVEYEPRQFTILDFTNNAVAYQKWCSEIMQEPLYFMDCELYRVKLFIHPDGRYGHAFIMHHLLADAYSFISIYLKSLLFKLYFNNNKLETYSYIDYVTKEQEYLNNSVRFQKDCTYWNEKVKEFCGENAFPGQISGNLESSSYNVNLGKECTEIINSFCVNHGIYPYNLFMGALAFYISKITRNNNISIGTPVLNRKTYVEKNTMGMFVNTLPFICDVKLDDTVIDYLHNIKKQSNEIFRHQQCPYEVIQEAFFDTHGYSMDMMEVMLSYQNAKSIQAVDASRYDIEWFTNRRCFNPLTINVFDHENNNSYNIRYDYQVNKISKNEIKKIHNRLMNIINEFIKKSSKLLNEVSCIDEYEKLQVLYEFNKTQVEYEKQYCINQLFEKKALQYSKKTAIIYNERTITYEELNRKANQLANHLIEIGVKKNDMIGITGPKEIESIIAMIGVLKAGGTYVPVNIKLPRIKQEYIIKDSGMKYILTTDMKEIKMLESRGSILIDLMDEKSYLTDQVTPTIQSCLNDAAYILYTSGTTGNPKGVIVEQRSLPNLVPMCIKGYGMTEEDVTLQFANMAFDQAVWDIWGTLLVGATICIADQCMLNNMVKFEEYVERNNVTVAALTPALLADLNPEKFNSLRIVESGGEAANFDVMKRWSSKVEVFNAYGPTEATINTTLWKYHQGSEKVLIGRPLPNIRVYVLNGSTICGVGMPGELCIAGDGLARGYLGLDEITNRVFIDGIGEIKERLYRSGDLVKWTEEGEIEYLGRIDNQVKIRGFRIELGEIEHAADNIDEIKTSIAVVRSDGGDNYLCLYYELNEGKEITRSEIRNAMIGSLADYMVPSVFVKVDKFPLTPNGKINKKLLPEVKKSDFIKDSYVPPETLMQKLLVQVYENVLGVTQVGIQDNFFDQGGHSLKVIKAINQIEEKTGVRLSAKNIFENPTIDKLSLLFDVKKDIEYNSIPKAEMKDYYKLSAVQRRLFVINRSDESSTTYNMPMGLKVKGALELSKVEAAFKGLLQRHEALRTSFFMMGEEVVQKVSKEINANVEYAEIPKASSEEFGKLFRDFIRPFDLSRAPLIRVKVGKVDDENWVIFFDMHHIISDGISVNILMKDFMSFYEGVELTDQTLQYIDFSEWMNGRDLTFQKEYWKNEFFGNLQALELPLDYFRGQEQSFKGNTIEAVIDNNLMNELKEFCSNTGTTEYMVMLSAFMLLLKKYSGQEDIVVGTPIAGRTHRDTENMVGMFVNTLALRGYVDENKTFIEFLEQMKEKCLKAYENQEYPFEELLEELHITRSLARNPLFDVFFAMQNTDDVEFKIQDITFNQLEDQNEVCKFDLNVEVVKKEDYYIRFQYCTVLFKEVSIQIMMKHYINLLKDILQKPNIIMRKLNMLDDIELNTILKIFNDTAMPYRKDKTIVELFEAQVMETPDNIAVVFEKDSLTYKELNSLANYVAKELRDIGVRPNDYVALISDRSSQLIVGILGIIKAGGAYVPIDPTYPESRIQFMIEDCSPKVAVIHGCNKPEVSIPVLELEQLPVMVNEYTNLEIVNKAEDLIYTIYTSGTTGRPKGVMIEHKAVHNLCCNMLQSVFKGYNNVNVALIAPYVFDVSVQEIFSTLLSGNTLHVISEDVRMSGEKMVEYYNKNNIVITDGTPLHIMVMAECCKNKDLATQKLLIAGEKLSKTVLDKINSCCNADVINAYGPTEATIYATYHICAETADVIPIGKPLKNLQIYIMNQMELCGIGVPGELCIAGDGVARGYLNRPEITDEKFIDNPFGEGKLYRTGDLARWLPNGTIDCIGRIDDQIKIRGFRIELGEIENALMRVEGVKNAAVTVASNEGMSHLLAYIASDISIEIEEVKECLRKELPEYMVPAYMVQIPEIPRTKNGKVDKKSLPEISIAKTIEYEEAQNEEEQIITDAFEDVLGISQIGRKDNFFENGGDSIKAIRIVSKLRNEGYTVTVKELLQAQTIENIAKKLKKVKNMVNYEQGEVTGILLLTPIQIDFMENNLPKPWHFNQSLVFKSKEKLDERAISEALYSIAIHHDVLRSIFVNGRQEILESNSSKLFEISTYNLGDELIDMEISREIRIKSQFIQQSMSLSQGPLMKAALFHHEKQDYLMICIHHLVVDGVSWRILIEDIETAYKQSYAGKNIILPAKTASYKEWSLALREYAGSKIIDKEITYWNNINELLKEQIGQRRKANAETNYSYANISLDKNSTSKLLYEAGKTYSTEITELLLSALCRATRRWSLKDEISVDLESHGREDIGTGIDINRTVGWFTSKYPIILTAYDDIGKNIIETKEVLRKIPNHGIGFGIIKYLRQEGFSYEKSDICFNYLGQMDAEDSNNALFTLSEMDAGEDTAKENGSSYSLSIDGGINNGCLKFTVTYDKAVYQHDDIECIKCSFKEELMETVNHCCSQERTVKSASDYDNELTSDALEELMDMFN